MIRQAWYPPLMVKKQTDSDTYSEQETVERREAALKRLLATPPQPHAKAKPGKAKRDEDKGAPKGKKRS
jgi:hypothetical protein